MAEEVWLSVHEAAALADCWRSTNSRAIKAWHLPAVCGGSPAGESDSGYALAQHREAGPEAPGSMTPPPEHSLSAREAAAVVGCSVSTIYRATKSGRLKPVFFSQGLAPARRSVCGMDGMARHRDARKLRAC
jgi:excisionase family DNA binding protein